MYMLHIIYAQHNIWWDNKIVGYNNYAHTVIRLTPSYIISIILALEHSKFDEHVPLKKINYLFNYKQCALFHHVIMCHILYSLVKTMCLVIYITILCYTYIESYPKKFRLSLEKGKGILIKECNPYLINFFTIHQFNNQIIICPVAGMNNYKLDTKGHCNNESRTIAGQNDNALSDITETSALNRTDRSALSNIDPDINYLNTNMKSINTQYYDDQQFRDKFKSNTNISMFHLNIRSIPEHFIELTSYIHSLNIDFKIIGISETWLKPFHTNYIIPNYNIEKDIRVKNRGGGVSLYIHGSLQYKLRNDLKIGNDPETINSVFVEVDKDTTGTKRNLIIGCIYRPPWVDLSEYNSCMTNTLALLQSENKYIFLLGDYNVDISPVAKHNLATKEFKNILSSEHFFPLINKPTRESNHSHTIIDNIYCNIPRSIKRCDSGILRPFISDHNAVFCVLNDTTVFNDKHSYIKRNFCKRNISKFCKFLKNELWNNIYYSGTQEAFTEFQRIIIYHFNKSFNKQTFTLTYKNRYPWMTNSLRTKIAEKNKLGLKSIKNPDIIELNRLYKRKRNQLISELRNTEIIYYINQLEIHKNDSKKSWKIFKNIIGKDSLSSKRKLKFTINNETVNDSQIIATEFNNFFTSIGPALADKITCSVDPISYVDTIINSIVITYVSYMDVKNTILSLKNSSPGYDEFSAFIAKQCIDYYVVPLAYVINMSLMEGIFPSELKLAKVVPIFKSGEYDKVNNYRPISVLSFFSKIFEKIMYTNVVNFMDKNDTFYKYQFGFRKSHSTQHAIITLVDKITSSLDSSDLIIGVFLDLKKAFDTVNHHIL